MTDVIERAKGWVVAIDLASDTDSDDVQQCARQMFSDLPREELYYMACQWAVSEVKATRRARTQAAEKAAAAPRETPEQRRQERQEREERREQDWHERSGMFYRLMKDLADNLHMEWTEELLASGFALPDGQVVTWGDATVAQHTQRAAMFQANVQANVEGAARHIHAITVLSEAGASCLRELVSHE